MYTEGGIRGGLMVDIWRYDVDHVIVWLVRYSWCEYKIWLMEIRVGIRNWQSFKWTGN